MRPSGYLGVRAGACIRQNTVVEFWKVTPLQVSNQMYKITKHVLLNISYFC